MMTWADFFKAGLGFVFGLLAFWLQRNFSRERRSLVGNVATFSLLSLPDSIRSQVTVHFRDTEVENILSHKITFQNQGNQVIQDHKVNVMLGPDAKILHVDPGARFEAEDPSNERVKMKLLFLNPGESTEVRIAATGGGKQDVTIDGEGPGIRFKSGERLLPVLDANMTTKDIEDVMRRQAMERMKRTGVWVLGAYALLFAVMMIIIWFTG